MKYRDLIEGMGRFGATEHDICLKSIGIEPEQIRRDVVIAPWWEPPVFPAFDKNNFLSVSETDSIKAWNVGAEGLSFTYIKTGIGAPVLMDVMLALGVTPCERAIFIGSVGALDCGIGIGDVVVPEFSICGDGASRYISHSNLMEGDVFGEKQYPDRDMFLRLSEATAHICETHDVKWHIGKTFSIDTVFAQFVHIDEIIGMSCNTIEMETAAAFRAAALAGIRMAALFSVSDNTAARKSLISGRTREEMQYRKYVRRELFPPIILDAFNNIEPAR